MRHKISELNGKLKTINDYPHLDPVTQTDSVEEIRQSITAMEEKVEATVKNLQSQRKDSKKARKDFLKQKARVAMLNQKGTEEKII